MKKIIMLLAVFVLIISCEEEAKSSKNATQKEKATVTTKVEPINLSTDNVQLLSTTIAYFKNCKANAETRNDCRNSITKMISEFYTIDDFKTENGEFVIYDSIQPIIKKSDAWVKLGNANDQEALNKAQQAANDGNATIAIDVSESYGQVAMIIPGKLTNSGSWKLEVPNAAALVNYSSDKSFMDKSLSYAFKSAENIVLFSKVR